MESQVERIKKYMGEYRDVQKYKNNYGYTNDFYPKWMHPLCE